MGRTTAQKKWRSYSQTWHKDYATAVGDTTKAYFMGDLSQQLKAAGLLKRRCPHRTAAPIRKVLANKRPATFG